MIFIWLSVVVCLFVVYEVIVAVAIIIMTDIIIVVMIAIIIDYQHYYLSLIVYSICLSFGCCQTL